MRGPCGSLKPRFAGFVAILVFCIDVGLGVANGCWLLAIGYRLLAVCYVFGSCREYMYIRNVIQRQFTYRLLFKSKPSSR